MNGPRSPQRGHGFLPGLLALALVVALFTPLMPKDPVFAAPGDLDPTFAYGGTITNIFGSSSIVVGIIVQPDGKILAGLAVYGSYDNIDFGVARYHANGTLDTDFGGKGNGYNTADFFGYSDVPHALVVQADGKVVVAGQAFKPGTATSPQVADFGLARFNTDGTVDASFGTGGKTWTDLSGTNDVDEVNALAIQSDGKIVATGRTTLHNNPAFGTARYTSDGHVDQGFGPGGTVITDNIIAPHVLDFANAVALQRDGRIVVAGVAGSNSALIRYRSDGTLDDAFGAGGKVIADVSGWDNVSDAINALGIQADGRIVAAGAAVPVGGSSSVFAITRYTAAGALDTTFGSGGIVLTPVGSGTTDVATALAIQPDGKVVVAGLTSNIHALLRYGVHGELDGKFGNNGKVTTDLGPYGNAVLSVAIQPDAKIVIGGFTHQAASGPNYTFISRFVVSD